MYIQAVLFVLLALILSACSSPGQSSPPTLVVPGGSVITASPGSSTTESVVIQTTKSIGTAVPGWESIPIMPGAYDAELEDMVYLYSVKASLQDIEEYYRTKMDINGWKLIDRKAMVTTSASGPATVLDFQKNGQSLNVMLVDSGNGQTTTVLLSRLGP